MAEGKPRDEGRDFRSSESLARFPEENPHPVMRVVEGGALVYANAASQPLLEAWKWRLPDDVRDRIAEAVKQSAPIDVEVRVEAEDELDERVYLLTVMPIVGAGYVNVYGREVTAEREREQQIRDLAKFPDENPNPVMRVGRDGTILYANAPSEPVLAEWGVRVAGALPEDIWKRVRAAVRADEWCLVEVPCGEQIYGLSFAPVPDARYINVYGRRAAGELGETLREIDAVAESLEGSDAADRLKQAAARIRTVLEK